MVIVYRKNHSLWCGEECSGEYRARTLMRTPSVTASEVENDASSVLICAKASRLVWIVAAMLLHLEEFVVVLLTLCIAVCALLLQYGDI